MRGWKRARDLSPEARRRRREVWIMVAVAITMVVLYLIERQVYQSQRIFPFGVNLLFFGILNVNIILVVTLLFLILRNLAKLIFERRKNIFGARLRTKLVAAFVSFALVPTVLFFYVSLTFIADSVERWFNVQIDASLASSLEVAKAFYASFEQNSRFHAGQVAEELSGTDMLTPAKEDALVRYLDARHRDYNLGQLLVIRADGSRVESTASTIPEYVRSRVPAKLLEKGLRGRTTGETQTVGGSEMVYGAAPIFATDAKDEVAGVAAVGYFVPLSLAAKTQEIRRNFDEYRQLQMLKTPIKSSYLIILVLIALLIFFSATWFGFYLSRDLIRPVQRLAEGTELVAAGNLDFQLQAEAADEFGQLVRSFNKMTSDLKASKEATQRAQADLEAKNLEIDQRRLYMETVLGNITAGVVSMDEHGVIETINRAAQRMLGLSSEKLLGRRYEEVLSPRLAPIVESLLAESKAGGRETITRQEEIAVGDRQLTVFLSCSRLSDDEGRRLGFVIVFEDLTQLLQAQRMAAWQEVARRIAHEIKNPLTPIQLSAQRLQKRFADRVGEDAPVFGECTNTIIRQVEEMKQLVNEFSKFARMAEIRPTPGDLNEVVAEALVLYREAQGHIRFEFRRDEAIPVFRFDRDQIKRVLINLLDNAVAAIGREGEIVVTTRLQPALNSALIEIADTGSGIPPEYRNRLFEPYFSTKRRGTGLGLAIVNRIVQDHNGYIRIRDNQPRGTVVSVELPLGARSRAQVA